MTVSHEALNRSLGRVEGAQTAMEKRLDHLEKTVADGFEKVGEGLEKIDRRLAAIEAKEAERKGAWKIIALVAGGVSALVASVVKYLIG